MSQVAVGHSLAKLATDIRMTQPASYSQPAPEVEGSAIG